MGFDTQGICDVAMATTVRRSSSNAVHRSGGAVADRDLVPEVRLAERLVEEAEAERQLVERAEHSQLGRLVGRSIGLAHGPLPSLVWTTQDMRCRDDHT